MALAIKRPWDYRGLRGGVGAGADTGGNLFPAVLTAVYAFLTIRFEDASILDFIRYACEFFFIRQQSFEWRRCSE